ncbi:MAG: electron transfer flavoprotein subunit beta/FixA family protein [Syntrophomonadaceae bacterium]|jgi:electron transfer flavoprotein beta subunit
MNIIVAMKQIPDLQQIRIRNRQPVFDDIPLTFGDIDKNALEAGVLLKEQLGGKLIVLSVGGQELEDTVKEALAAGADEAVLIIGENLGNIDGSLVSWLLAAAIKNMEDVGVILFGEGSGDNYSGQVGSRVAEILDLPQVGYASSIDIKGNSAVITRSMDDYEEIVEVEMPVAITVLADINEPRIPSVTQILKAGRKPKQVLELQELGIDISNDPRVVTVSNLAPENARKQVKVDSAEELIQLLKTEGVIGG